MTPAFGTLKSGLTEHSITAPYLPACLVAFSWLLQGGFKEALADIVGPGNLA